MTLMKSAPPIVAPEALAKIVSTYRSVQEGVPTRCQFMSALGHKRTCAVQEAMSALGHKRTFVVQEAMSALGQ